MKKVLITQQGFTLSEVLISLVITSILTLTTYPTLLRVYDYYQLNRVMTIFQSDLHYVRDSNMGPFENYETISLRIYTNENRYELSTSLMKDPLFSRQLPKNIYFPLATSILTINFSPSGNVLKGQTIIVKSRYYSKQVVFSIGTGGFDIRDPN